MNSLLISLRVVMPMLLLMLTGRLLRHIGLLPESLTETLNKLVSLVFLPCLVFINMYDSNLKTTFNARLFFLVLCGVLVNFAMLMLIVPRLVKDNKRRAVIIHALFRGNTAIFGIPLAQGIMGADGNIDDLIVVMTVTIILYNILGVITLQVYGEMKTTAGSVIKGIVTSPMVVGSVLGLVLALTGWRLPAVAISPVSGLATVTTPLAFLSLGASFNLTASIHNRKYLVGAVSTRLILIPLIWFSVGIGILGLRGGAVAALIAAFATPSAVSTFPLATQAGADGELAGELVVFSTGFSILTLFGWIWLLAGIGVL